MEIFGRSADHRQGVAGGRFTQGTDGADRIVGQWSDAVRFPLIWLGQEDPVDSMEEARDEDPERIAARALLLLVKELYAAPRGPTALGR